MRKPVKSTLDALLEALEKDFYRDYNSKPIRKSIKRLKKLLKTIHLQG